MSFVRVEREEPIAVVLLDRPQQLNALSDDLMDELVSVLRDLDDDESIRCIVLGGSERAFAAGADIGELATASPIDLYYQRRIDRWDAIRSLWTPLVAAVSGYCLGGGCELAMVCDLIVASESAVFGQPETGVGIIPGAGGTQRLTRAVGKSVAMDVVLSGRRLNAREALESGLVARVVAREAWLDEAKRVAREIASKAPVATRLAKEAVDHAYEGGLGYGLDYERRAMYLAFASADAREGLNAFLEKYEAELVLVQIVVPPNEVDPAVTADLAIHAQDLAGSRGRAVVAIHEDPARAIVQAADEEDVDVVVVGNVGMSGRKEFLLGNVPNRVSHLTRKTCVIVNTAQRLEQSQRKGWLRR